MTRLILFALVLILFISHSSSIIPQFPLSLEKLHFFNAILRYTAAQRALGHRATPDNISQPEINHAAADNISPHPTIATHTIAALPHSAAFTPPAITVTPQTSSAINDTHLRYRRATFKPDFTFATVPPRVPTYPPNHRDTQILMRPSPNQIIEFTNRAAVHSSYTTYHDRCSDIAQLTNGLIFERCVEYLLFFEQESLDPALLRQIKTAVPSPEERKQTAAKV